jgi:predicted O-methyltransferase YrrM
MNNIEHFYQNIGENWFDYADLYSKVANDFPNGSHFVEIGSWKGRSASCMAVEIHNLNKNIKFDCIDTWNGSAEHKNGYFNLNNLYNEFLNNIQPVNHIINPIRMDSLEASKLYANKSLDFVFIDASHEYEDIKNDIIHWLPKVKIGGILAGHDIVWPGVARAVSELIPNHYLTSSTCWAVNIEHDLKEMK